MGHSLTGPSDTADTAGERGVRMPDDHGFEDELDIVGGLIGFARDWL